VNLLDVNVMVYAFRRDSPRHDEFRIWLLEMAGKVAAFGVSEQALSSVIRICTHPKIFKKPSLLEDSIKFVESLRAHPSCRIVRPTSDHWDLFIRLCRHSDARGNLVTDAWFAALAMDAGCAWVTTDRDFARFPGLRWRHPLDHVEEVQNPELPAPP